MPTLSITVDAAQAARIAEAYGEFLTPVNLQNPLVVPVPQPATMEMIRKHIIGQMTAVVLDYERRKAQRAVAEPAPFTPT